MSIRIITESISREDLQELANIWYKTLIKGAVDIESGLVALGGEWHIDACEVLTSSGSNKDNVWGFNILMSERSPENAFEYHSMINIKPIHNHKNMEIEFEDVRNKVFEIVSQKVIWPDN
jgi:hypothetical protein